jgi:hypothetical protein
MKLSGKRTVTPPNPGKLWSRGRPDTEGVNPEGTEGIISQVKRQEEGDEI